MKGRRVPPHSIFYLAPQSIPRWHPDAQFLVKHRLSAFVREARTGEAPPGSLIACGRDDDGEPYLAVVLAEEAEGLN